MWLLTIRGSVNLNVNVITDNKKVHGNLNVTDNKRFCKLKCSVRFKCKGDYWRWLLTIRGLL